jgi:hypothetical protein
MKRHVVVLAPAKDARSGAIRASEVRTKRGITRALLFPKVILEAEREADTPLREALAIKRETLRARREERKKA